MEIVTLLTRTASVNEAHVGPPLELLEELEVLDEVELLEELELLDEVEAPEELEPFDVLDEFDPLLADDSPPEPFPPVWIAPLPPAPSGVPEITPVQPAANAVMPIVPMPTYFHMMAIIRGFYGERKMSSTRCACRSTPRWRPKSWCACFGNGNVARFRL